MAHQPQIGLVRREGGKHHDQAGVEEQPVAIAERGREARTGTTQIIA